MMPALSHAPKVGEAVPLEVWHYGNAPSTFALYDDDGTTFDYTHGGYRWHNLEVVRGAEGSLQGNNLVVEPGWNSSYSEVVWRFL